MGRTSDTAREQGCATAVADRVLGEPVRHLPKPTLMDMALTLEDADLARLRSAQECLLSISTRPSIQAWCEDVVEEVRRLFRTDAVHLLLPHRTGVELESTPELAAFRAVLAGVDVGAVRFSQSQVEESHALRRHLDLEVWSNSMLVELDGRAMERSGWHYREFTEPAGVAEGGGLTVRLPLGEAMLLVTPGRPGPNPFGDEWLELARLLLPAFKAAVRQVQQRQWRHDQVLWSLDRVDTALCLFDAAGTLRHRNPAANALLDDEPRAADLMRRAAGVAREASRLRRVGLKPEPPRTAAPGERTVRVGSTRYRISALFLGPHVVDIQALVVVQLSPVSPGLPSVRSLRDRFGLTRRQAEVALLLAKGASNREIAAALAISPHTVRSHGEVVFQKLDIHTRKALALRLIGSATTA